MSRSRVCQFSTNNPEIFAKQIAVKTPYPNLRPGEAPQPWAYDEKNDRYWNPEHQHWHPGRPPADKKPGGQ